LARAQAGEAVEWGHVEHLLAAIVDVLQAANWQRAGNRNAPKPQPVRRPGVAQPGERRFRSRRSFTPAEFQAVWSRGGEEVS